MPRFYQFLQHLNSLIGITHEQGSRSWYTDESKKLLLCVPYPEFSRDNFYRGTLGSCFTQQFIFAKDSAHAYKLEEHTDLICTG